LNDPSTQRVVGASLVAASVATMALLAWIIGDGPVPYPEAVAISAVAAGLGGGGLSQLVRSFRHGDGKT
jgi:hypothetical protein